MGGGWLWTDPCPLWHVHAGLRDGDPKRIPALTCAVTRLLLRTINHGCKVVESFRLGVHGFVYGRRPTLLVILHGARGESTSARIIPSSSESANNPCRSRAGI